MTETSLKSQTVDLHCYYTISRQFCHYCDYMILVEMKVLTN